MVGLVVYSLSIGDLSWRFILRWGFASLIVILMVSIDLAGSTPVYKSGLLEGRLLQIVLDREICHGAGFCEAVCPRDCYELDKNRHVATIPRIDRCIQCGACIVQCPFDALHLASPQGGIITPEDIRRFKLNMMGKRMVKVG